MNRRILLAIALAAFAALSPAANVLHAQGAAVPPWVGKEAPGTNLMVWIQGPEQALDKYVEMAQKIWMAYPKYFRYPLPDAPGLEAGSFNSRRINPDSRVDIYLIDRVEPDPRLGNCQDCALGTNAGAAREDPDTLRARTGSGYVLLNKTLSDDEVIDTMAHEIAHVAQRAYDWDERRGGEVWMQESTATWVAYKVMIEINSSRAFEYRLLDKSLPSLDADGLRPPFFQHLHEQLHRTGNNYSGFLFFFYASQVLGDGIVSRVWQEASKPGPQGIEAVGAAIDLAEHFPRFAVRNWNKEYLPVRYRDDDPTFPTSLAPEPVQQMPSGLGTFDLSQDTTNLGSRYYRFEWPDQKVRRVTLQNFYAELPDAHIWAIRKIGNDWKDPEDWSRDAIKTLCRDEPTENVTELVLVVSNSHLRFPISRIAPSVPKPRVLVEDVGCAFIEGGARSTLRLKDDTQDVTYTSSRATLRFRPRSVQDQPGNVQYDLMPTAVTWTVSGMEGDCTVAGQAVVTIPAFLDLPLDPTRLAFGYLNVVGLDGGDFHSVEISAVSPGATYTKTCPGDPPIVTQEGFKSVWLSHVLSKENTHDGNAVAFSGTQTFDPERFQDSLPAAARDILFGTPSTGTGTPRTGLAAPSPGVGNVPGVTPPGLGGGFTIPGIDPQVIEDAMKRAREALQQADLQGGKLVYTFEWDLKPVAGTPQAP